MPVIQLVNFSTFTSLTTSFQPCPNLLSLIFARLYHSADVCSGAEGCDATRSIVVQALIYNE